MNIHKARYENLQYADMDLEERICIVYPPIDVGLGTYLLLLLIFGV